MEAGDDDKDSVYNVFWDEEETRKYEVARVEKIDKKDPLKLLSKLENYSKDNLNKMFISDKEELINEIEGFLNQGLTPLERYYKDLKKHFTLPSANLIQTDKMFFFKQLDKIRGAQQQETANIMKKAEIIAKNMLDRMLNNVKTTLKKDLDKVLDDYNKVRAVLSRSEYELKKWKKIAKDQEFAIIEMKLMSTLGKFKY